jgi:hypothetical protein
MTTTQQMKLDALQTALTKADQCATAEIINFNKTWRLTCGCHNLTSFGFYFFYARGTNGDRIDWGPHGTATEDEAKAFLRGLGHDDA